MLLRAIGAEGLTMAETASQFKSIMDESFSLDSLPLKRVARVVEVDGNHPAGERLLALGVLPGREIFIDGVAPLGDPIAVCSGTLRLAVRRNDAACVRLALDAEALS